MEPASAGQLGPGPAAARRSTPSRRASWGSSRRILLLGNAEVFLLPAATGAFLDQRDHAPSTRRVYTASLAALVDGFGTATRVDELDPAGTAAWFRLRYKAAAPATWNRELVMLRSAVMWWRTQGWLAADPTVLIERRRQTPDRTRALTVAQPQGLWRREDVALRDKTLWRLLYETAARATEVLGLDANDLDLANKRARVRSKGGATEWVFWQTRSAQLLPRLLARAHRRPSLPRRPPAHPGRGHPRPRQRNRAGPAVRPPSRPPVLHGDRLDAAPASALGADPRRRGRHQPPPAAGPVPAASVRSLERYARPSPEAVARHLAATDPARRPT